MELLHRLPNDNLLSIDSPAIEDREDDGMPYKQLNLAINHRVTSAFCSGKTSPAQRVLGDSAITYQIDIRLPKVCDLRGPLRKSKINHPIAYHPKESFKQVLETLRVRSPYAIDAYARIEFDMRALSYVLGRAVALGGCSGHTTTHTVNLKSRQSAPIRSLEMTWNNPSNGDILIPPSLLERDAELITLQYLVKNSFGSHVIYLNDRVPSEAPLLEGPRLAAFAHRLQIAILSTAQTLQVAGHHDLAFFRGINSVLTLRSHTDEGGWIRKALAEASYPAPRGIIAPMASEMASISAFDTANVDSMFRWSVAYLLRGAAMSTLSDGNKNGLPYAFDGTDTGVAADIALFEQTTYSHFEKWRAVSCEMLGSAPDGITDLDSMNDYFNARYHDNHLTNDIILPFQWVTSDPLLGIETNLDRFATPEKPIELPLFHGLSTIDVATSANYMESDGLPSPGSSALLWFKEFRPRLSGMSYILNSRYSNKNGLSLLSQTGAYGKFSASSTKLYLSNQAARNHAEQRWKTPHSPVCCPGECYMDLPTVFKFDFIGVPDHPNAVDLVTAKVTSTVGSLYITSHQKIKDSSGADVVPGQFSVAPRTLINRLRSVYPGRRITLSTSAGYYPAAEDGSLHTHESLARPLHKLEEVAAADTYINEIGEGLPKSTEPRLDKEYGLIDTTEPPLPDPSVLESAVRLPPPDGQEIVRLNLENSPPVRLSSPTVVPSRQRDDQPSE